MEKLITYKEGESVFLVFLFCILLLLIIILLFLIILSTLKITIKKFELSNINKGIVDKKVKANFNINIGLFLFGKIKIFNSKITDDKLEKITKKINIKNKIKNIDFKNLKGKIKLDKETKDFIKDVKIIEISRFNLNLEIGTEDVIFTSFLITILSVIISIILSRTLKKEAIKISSYKVLPIYNNKNLIKISFDGIINLKIVHIIFIIFNLLKKGRVDKDGRTSNRRTYDYSYE